MGAGLHHTVHEVSGFSPPSPACSCWMEGGGMLLTPPGCPPFPPLDARRPCGQSVLRGSPGTFVARPYAGHLLRQGPAEIRWLQLAFFVALVRVVAVVVFGPQSMQCEGPAADSGVDCGGRVPEQTAAWQWEHSSHEHHPGPRLRSRGRGMPRQTRRIPQTHTGVDVHFLVWQYVGPHCLQNAAVKEA